MLSLPLALLPCCWAPVQKRIADLPANTKGPCTLTQGLKPVSPSTLSRGTSCSSSLLSEGSSPRPPQSLGVFWKAPIAQILLDMRRGSDFSTGIGFRGGQEETDERKQSNSLERRWKAMHLFFKQAPEIPLPIPHKGWEFHKDKPVCLNAHKTPGSKAMQAVEAEAEAEPQAWRRQGFGCPFIMQFFHKETRLPQKRAALSPRPGMG